MRDRSENAIKILTFTTLYPNSIQTSHGIFVENRLQHLVADRQVEARVLAPVPWFPSSARVFGRYADFMRIPERETRNSIEVLHPRYPVIPKIGMNLAPFLLYRFSKPAIKRFLREGFGFDLIDAHYFYPDGIAAILLGRYFNKPVTITARGTDINLISRYMLPRRMIRWAASRAAGLVTVCEALKNELVALNIESERIRVLRNGVDLSVFRPTDRGEACERIGLASPVIISVGHLIPRKGHDLVIQAMSELPDATLVIVGKGPEKSNLERLAKKLGISHRVRFMGAIEHKRMRKIYSAANVLVLASDREGWPNVLLESMACGTPVVASNVWGVPEIIKCQAAGLLLEDRSPAAIAAAVRTLLRGPPARSATRAYAEQFDWSATTQGQLDLFREILGSEPSHRPATLSPAP